MTERAIPWGLLERLAGGAVSDDELEAVTPLLLQEPVEPPDWFVARALKIPHQATPSTAKPGLLPRLAAELLFDSALRPQLAGIRGNAAARRLTYTAGSFTAHLEARTEGPAVTLSGQVLASTPPRYEVEVVALDGKAVEATALTNDFGYFSFQGLPSASYSVLFHTPDQEVEIGVLSL